MNIKGILAILLLTGVVLSKTGTETLHVRAFFVAGPWDILYLRPESEYVLTLDGEDAGTVRTNDYGYARIVVGHAGVLEMNCAGGLYCTPARIE